MFLGEVLEQFLRLAWLDLGELDGIVTGPSLELPQLIFACFIENSSGLSRCDRLGIDQFSRQCQINYSMCSGLAITVRV